MHYSTSRRAEHAVFRGCVGGRIGRPNVNKRLDRTDVDDPAPGRAELSQKSMCHVEHPVVAFIEHSEASGHLKR
jgi:hypothetical protein